MSYPFPAVRPLALAIHLLVLGGACALGAPVALAQESAREAAAQSPRRSYDIPAGALGGALIRFSHEAGVSLVGAGSAVEGRRSPGLKGSYSVQGGLAALLAGTGLEAFRQADGSYGLRPAPATTAAGEVELPAVTVTANVQTDGITEGSGSYTTEVMSTATKLPLSIRETPQSVTVITRERMDDQGMSTPRDALLNTPGIAITSISGPNRNIYYSRGFQVQNYTFDGLPAILSSAGGQVLMGDLAMYDRVEIVRGAAGLTQGVGTPSAAINFVRKRPTRDFQASVEGQLGRWNHYGAEVDVSGPLNAAGSLRGRAVVYGRDSDSFQDVVGEKRQLLYLIGEADITPDTLLTLSLSRLRNDNITTYAGLPTGLYGEDLKLPRSTFLGNKWNYWDETNTSAFASLEHRFGNRWKLNFSINQIWGDQRRFVNGIWWDNGQYDLGGTKASLQNDRTSYELNAQGPFRLFGREHELSVGASRRSADEGNDTAGYWPPIYMGTNIDIWNWHHDAPKPTSVTEDFRYRSSEKQHGIYGTTRLNVMDSLKLILGLRLDWYDFNNTTDILDSGSWTRYAGGYEYDRHLTKYAGLVFDLDKRHSVYASYTDIFQPQDARDASNDFIEPIVGKNYEVGVKGEYFSGALNVSASLFRIDQDNRAMEDGPCPFNPQETCYRAAGRVRSQGYDLEIQGALTPNWQIGAGYTYAAARVKKDSDPSRIGVRLDTHLPTRQFKLSTSYRLPGGQWRVGGNMRWQNTIYHDDDWEGHPYHTRQRAYAVVDAMAGYRYDKHLDIQLNITNLFDKVYYQEMSRQPMEWGGNALYGEPRRFMLTAKYSF